MIAGQARVENWNKQNDVKIPVDIDSELDLEDGGNKHRRIMEQVHMTELIGLPGIVVPRPHVVTSTSMQRFVNEWAPEVAVNWKKMDELYNQFQKNKPDLVVTDFLRQPQTELLLKQIDNALERAFVQASQDDKVFNSLSLNPKMLEWLKALQKENKYLIVRSSGSEDSRKAANAGGNASPPYIMPDRSEICIALGEVVRSYFGKASLQNRLNANEVPFFNTS